VEINGEMYHHFRVEGHEGEVLVRYVAKRCIGRSAVKLLRKAMKRLGKPVVLFTSKLRSDGAAIKVGGDVGQQETRH
jgi:putative transposase